MNIHARLSYLGQWQYGDLSNAILGTYALIDLGPDKLMGIVLAGSFYSPTPSASITPTNIAILEQNPDGNLSINTSKYISSSSINGGGQIIVADFNGDYISDIFIAASNESPMISATSTAFLSKIDGFFKKISINDLVEAQSTTLGLLHGVKTIVSTGYGSTDPFYQYSFHDDNFKVGEWGSTYSGKIYGSTALVNDFNGDGNSELVIGDFVTGPGYAFDPTSPAKLAIYQLNGDALSSEPAFITPLYFDDNLQYQNQGLVSEYPGLSHNYRVWQDDFNHDLQPDLLLGVGVWSARAGWAKSKLQMLQNQGELEFSDVTDQLGQAYDENDVCVDYSMQMIDLDQSGIFSYLMAGDTYSTGDLQSSYLLLNDGSGNLYTALHDEFVLWSEDMALRFIPYQLPDKTINYLAQTVNGALYILPIQYNITTDFTQNITIVDRNSSMLLRTWAGNDTFYDTNANTAAAHINGGLGIDTSSYSGTHTQYLIQALASQSFEVTLTATNSIAPKVDDTLVNVERLSFTDGTLALDIAPGQNAGEVYRLYQAAFARTPDMPGVKYHLNDMEANGLPLWQIASNFLASPEFATQYGQNPTDTQYINALYHNVLNRTPGQSEVDWYQNQFNTKAMDHQAALIGFSESPENVALVGSAIVNGIWLG
jgi:hypothetical protein